jgi:hypothetical protein
MFSMNRPAESSEWGIFDGNGKCLEHGLLKSVAEAKAETYGADCYADEMDAADWEGWD